MKQQPISPLHAKHIRSFRPPNMTRLTISNEQNTFLQQQAISIFTDCANAGLSFQDSLSAILASGMDWGMNFKDGDKE